MKNHAINVALNIDYIVYTFLHVAYIYYLEKKTLLPHPLTQFNDNKNYALKIILFEKRQKQNEENNL